jgi:general secretion pathway protein I
MRHPFSSPRGTEGFTILEVLVAFVIFAVTLAALLQVFSGGLRDAQLADEYARAVMAAQSRLALYTAAEKLEETALSGVDAGFAWELSAAPYDERQEQAAGDVGRDYNLRVRLLRVESRVAWRAADGRDRDVRLATLVLGSKP